MRATHLVLSILALALPASLAPAQLTVIPNTGCKDGTAVGDEIFPVAGQAPTVGNLTFGLEHVCPFGATAAFVVWGTCNTGPLINWDLTATCFNWWGSPPGSCRAVYGMLYPLDGGLTRQGKFVWSFPILPIPELATVTQANPICLQIICVDLDSDPDRCLSVSQGLQMIIQ